MQENRLYSLFITLFTISVAFNVWNIVQQHKLRKLQKQDLIQKNGNNHE